MKQLDHLIADRIRPLFMPSLTWLSLGTSISVWMYGTNVSALRLSVSDLQCLEVTKYPESLTDSTVPFCHTHTYPHSHSAHTHYQLVCLRRMKFALQIKFGGNRRSSSLLLSYLELQFKRTRKVLQHKKTKKKQTIICCAHNLHSNILITK